MVIRKKSKEELKSQSEWFLEYEEKAWNITNQKKEEILWVLSSDSFDIIKKQELKDKLGWTLSDSEFDGLYLEYLKYWKERFTKIKALLEEMKLLPEWYEFLFNDILNMILQDWNTVEELEDFIKDENQLTELRNIIKHNIYLLEKIPDIKKKHFKELSDIIVEERYSAKIDLFINAWINNADDFIKLKDIISSWYKDNIAVLIEAWIRGVDNFVKLKDIICWWHRNNIETFANAWIKDADDFLKLKNFISFRNSDFIKLNVETLSKAWIKKADDFVKLSDIVLSSYPNDVKSNIEVLSKAWIISADDFVKLKDIIFSGNIDHIKENIEILKKAWIKDVDDFVKLKRIICTSYWSNIEMFVKIWIKDVDDFVKLTPIICSPNKSCVKLNIETLSKAWIKKPDDFLNLIDVIRSDFTDYIKSIVEVFLKAWIKEADDFIKLKDIIWDWNADYVQENIEMLVSLWIKEADDFVKLKDLICVKNSRNVGENIRTLLTFWIKNSDDLARLKDIIRSWSTDCIKDNLEVLFEAWIKDIDWLEKMRDIICWWNRDNIVVLIKAWIKDADDFVKLKEIICFGLTENLEVFVDAWINDVEDFLKLKDIIRSWYPENIKLLKEYWIKDVADFVNMKDVINNWYIESIRENFEILKGLWIKDVDDLVEMNDVICQWYPDIVKSNVDALKIIWIKAAKDFVKLKEVIFLGSNAKYNLFTLKKYWWIDGVDDIIALKDLIIESVPDNLIAIFGNFDIKRDDLWTYKKLFCFTSSLFPWWIDFKEKNHEWYLKYFNEVVGLDDSVPRTDILKIIFNIAQLPICDIENYLNNLKEFCIKQKHHYDDFLKCFDWKSINLTAVEFLSRWFYLPWPDDVWDTRMLTDSIKLLYPKLSINFNNEEAKKILWFVDSLGWVNKWYTILILTIEKMVKDCVNCKNFNRILLEKLEGYKKILDMYPDDKIPEWLKISVWLEFEMTQLYTSWYKRTTWNSYFDVVNRIVEKAKINYENEWAFEFATRPSTNPMAALLEIHLLQELNLLDINDMQKLSWDPEFNSFDEDDKKKDLYENPEVTRYKTKKWTWYHLNIWSDSDIWVDDNIHFIQNLCTIIPRAWINNWEDVEKINRYNDINSKSGFSIFSDSESTKYVELRTYSVDDVELFEKNVLFNTYAIMWSQAQKKVSTIKTEIIYELKNNDGINNSDDLMRYMDDNNLFKEGQDIKSKKIATEFIFLQIAVLRSLLNYNKNFINDELFDINEISYNLNDSWKNYFLDLLCLDWEQIWYIDDGHSSRFVKYKCKHLYNAFKNSSFDFKEYLEKTEPFSDDETKQILDEYWESVDINIIHRITTRLNKRLLWEKLIIWCDDTQNLENLIKEKKWNFNRIKNSIRWMDQSLNIDRQYLQNYFKTYMSLSQFDIYSWMSINFMNKIIHLNNFFLKKDDTNANWVLKKTVFEWEEEADISEKSIFETWYMRKWYNYFQWWTENMLLHSTQKIAMNYMGNVKNILNADYGENNENTQNLIKYNQAA